jgi:glycosyltransferase involved in cell wall biosynthesis
MRVGLLSHNAQFGDAIGNQIAEKARFFLERGADVRVFVESDRRLHPALRPITRRLISPDTSGSAWEFLSTADLVIAEYSQFYSLLALLPLLDRRKTRVIFDYHGVTPPGFFSGSQREALEQARQARGWVWCADRVVSHSRFMAEDLRAATSFPAQRIEVLPHPVDRSRFCPGTPGRDLRQTLGLGDATILLFVGRLATNKRLPVLVQALAGLRDLMPPAHAVLAGDSGDVYGREVQNCRDLAAERGVADRLHFLDHVNETELVDAYRSADVFVMPSIHEGFCIPVIEAMACGVPVIAARATALPETVGSAGLTFRPDDANDLEQQLRRVLVGCVKSAQTHPEDGSNPACVRADLTHPTEASTLRVAVVSFRYGTDFAGGAEQSLRTLAAALHQAGHVVEVFTTCTRSESRWSNDWAEGTFEADEMPVHRFEIDAHDRKRHLHSVRAILEADGAVTGAVEGDYLRHSIHSSHLVAHLQQRIGEFDAVIVGPYLHGLTWDIAQAFPEKTLLVPCFHDEPFARLQIWLDAYSRIGGILYHSPEEQELAEGTLGLNHPGGVCVGTYLEAGGEGDAERGRAVVGSGRRYLVYCGRYSVQKNLPLLLGHARRYAKLHPDRVTFTFMGEGEVAIPREEWVRDLGFIDSRTKNDVLAGADALLQLSQNESLSLVALEAWLQGTPVIGHSRCPVLAGHLRRCGGGWTVDSFDSFAAALDALWGQPEQARLLGQRGRAYVMEQYASQQALIQRLTDAIKELHRPRGDRLRRRGLERARQLDRAAWRERFGQLVEGVLEAPVRTGEPRLEIQPRRPVHVTSAGQEQVLLAAHVANRGTGVAVHEGPGRLVLCAQVWAGSGDPRPAPRDPRPAPAGRPFPEVTSPLPCLIPPDQQVPVAMAIPAPSKPGDYRVALYARPAQLEGSPSSPPDAWLQLKVTAGPVEVSETSPAAPACCTPALEAVHKAVIEAARRQQLPDDYLDVTEGFFAGWKRRIKRKLLGNFKHAYVDVLSRQQSRFNRQVVVALQELAECFAVLNHARKIKAIDQRNREQVGAEKQECEFLTAAIERAVVQGRADELAGLLHGLAQQVANGREKLAGLEERLARLEQTASRSKPPLPYR